eukprot:CAMPEP_0198235912 /NCGR_PEP_ID=MMETSP1446-20131203/1797_1 /TAXON_ID=1461542 ORGANISM="Unidentified sp, Strain CCMP2111" /NCGR_SAMPLE_ID=MMETSP1446 /ASSEMBLY_ACC=CAM_ASM_001112 /LENGTH=604 /DNA_ID=CAMNT_0043917357 /DNA_START=65 /DNA_END=1879 /DNA_ORIENTATION=-
MSTRVKQRLDRVAGKWLALAVVLALVGIAVAQDAPAASDTAATTTTITVDGVSVTEVQCETGVYDCDNSNFYEYLAEEAPENPQCAPYNNHFVNPTSLKWVVGVGAVIAMVMAYGIGSNDAANSWGTSVGSGAIPLRWGCFVGGIMEWAGAVSIGYGVAKTIKGTANIASEDCFACGYCNSAMSLYAIAMFASLFSAAVFLLLASTTWMPVSTTHAIIGGSVGATWVAVGWGCLNWKMKGGLGGIVLSWVLSPVLSGVIASIAYLITYYTIINPKLGGNPKRNALIGSPFLYGAQSYVMLFLILLKAPQTKKKYSLKEFALFAIPAGVGVGIISALYVYFYVRRRMPSVRAPETEDKNDVPELEQDMTEKQMQMVEMEAQKDAKEGTDKHHIPSPKEVIDSARELGNQAYGSLRGLEGDDTEGFSVDQQDAIYCFKSLLVFVAALESFAHGSNDTGNATGAFSAMLQTFQEGTTACAKPETPVWVMAVAGFFVFLGVNTYGYRVIETIGTNITKINFHRGWCVEFASTFTVIIATVLSMPVSTTHCQVGAVVAVGLTSFGPKKVAWSLFGKIFLAWVLTLPFAGGIAAALTAALRPAIYGSGRA